MVINISVQYNGGFLPYRHYTVNPRLLLSIPLENPLNTM